MGKDRSGGRSEDGAERRLTGSPREFQFHGRRYGHRLRKGRRALIENRLPALRVCDPSADAPVSDLGSLFAGPMQGYWLEIGFGAGEHLAAQALAHPDIGFLGCEPFINGVAALLAKMEADDIANIRLFDEDARFLLPRLPEGVIDRVFILFSDPWPKKRHNKRRIITPKTLDALARILRPGGELRFASDDMSYISWTLEHMRRCPEFSWPAAGPADWRNRPADAVETRYERKALEQGRRCIYLGFRRN